MSLTCALRWCVSRVTARLSPAICVAFALLMLCAAFRVGSSVGDEKGVPPVKLETAKAPNSPSNIANFDDLSPERINWIKAAVWIQNGDVRQLEDLLRSDPGLATRTVDATVLTTLLHHACTYDQTDAIKVLLKHGADTLAKTSWMLETPLHVAARTDSIESRGNCSWTKESTSTFWATARDQKGIRIFRFRSHRRSIWRPPRALSESSHCSCGSWARRST